MTTFPLAPERAARLLVAARRRALGGPGSGNFGHAGRPGQVGGSSKDGGEKVAVGLEDDVYKYYPSAPDLRDIEIDADEIGEQLLEEGQLDDEGFLSLYHVTLSDPKDILREGLIPGKVEAPAQDWVAEHSSYATYFFRDREHAIDQAKQSGPGASVIRAQIAVIEQTLRRLVPDEDAGLGPREGIRAILNGENVGVIGGVPSYALTKVQTGGRKKRALGGPGSGNFGHAGRPGEIGGSQTGDVARWRRGDQEDQELNGVLMRPDPSPTFEINRELVEPPLEVPRGKHVSAGVVVVEPDGRVWVVEPKDNYGGYRNTFPKGTVDDDEDLQETALREVWEETGLVASVTDHLIDVERSTSVARFYIGKRIGGAPWAAGEETHAVKLLPIHGESTDRRIKSVYGRKTSDRKVLDALRDYVGVKTLGGPGSGNFGHSGRPGEVGGSAQSSFPQDLQKVSGAKGSNPGGVYVDKTGQKWYVKHYSNKDQAATEHVANEVYRRIGVDVPHSELSDDSKQIALEWEKSQGVLNEIGLNKENANAILDGFAGDVFLMNWDAVGLGHDNVIIKPDGSPMRVDQGGTLLYRAQGAPKPESMLHKIGEWESLQTQNHYYAQVFKAAGVKNADALGDRVIKQIDRIIAARPDGGWRSLVDRKAPNASESFREKVGKMLEARQKALEEKREKLLKLRAAEERYLKYDPDQPRAPKGSPDGGKWTAEGGGGGEFVVKKKAPKAAPVSLDAKKSAYAAVKGGMTFKNAALKFGMTQGQLAGYVFKTDQLKAQLEGQLDPDAALGNQLTPEQITQQAEETIAVEEPPMMSPDDALPDSGEQYDKNTVQDQLDKISKQTEDEMFASIASKTGKTPGQQAYEDKYASKVAGAKKWEDLPQYAKDNWDKVAIEEPSTPAIPVVDVDPKTLPLGDKKAAAYDEIKAGKLTFKQAAEKYGMTPGQVSGYVYQTDQKAKKAAGETTTGEPTTAPTGSYAWKGKIYDQNDNEIGVIPAAGVNIGGTIYGQDGNPKGYTKLTEDKPAVAKEDKEFSKPSSQIKNVGGASVWTDPKTGVEKVWMTDPKTGVTSWTPTSAPTTSIIAPPAGEQQFVYKKWADLTPEEKKSAQYVTDLGKDSPYSAKHGGGYKVPVGTPSAPMPAAPSAKAQEPTPATTSTVATPKAWSAMTKDEQMITAHNEGYQWKEKTYGPQAGKYAWFKDGVQVSAPAPKGDYKEGLATINYGKGVVVTPPEQNQHAQDWPVGDHVVRQMGSKYPTVVQEKAEPWIKGLTYKERSAIESYTGSAYGSWNSILRTGGEKTDSIKAMEKALDKAPTPPPPELVWRGISGSTKQFESLGVGDVIEMKGFQSTSIKPEFAHSWGGGKILFEIKPTAGGYVRSISQHSSEYEYVLPHGKNYTVVGVTKVALGSAGSKHKVIQLQMHK